MRLRRVRMGLGSLVVVAVGGGIWSTASGQVAMEQKAQPNPTVGSPLVGLSETDVAAFQSGLDTFNEVETVDDGLGPVFNERACGSCHNVGAAGGSGLQFEVRAGKLVAGLFDSLASEGGQLFDLFSVTDLPAAERTAIPGCTLPPGGEPIPLDATVTALRRTTALFGLGLVDATPDGTFQAIALAEPAAIRGRAPLVPNIAAGHPTVGKFGWKDQVPTLHQFSGDAYLNEMGITNPEFPAEQIPRGNPLFVTPCDGKPVEPGDVEDHGDDVDAFTTFMTLLAPPPVPVPHGQAILGSTLFTQIGCDGCHVRSITSGVSPVAALSNQAYQPFSDFLVHDMGTLGDGIPGNGDVGGREMRTAPLWGLRFLAPTNLLHDGRATSVEDAILRHDGQAATARNAFAALPPGKKNILLAFVSSL